MRRRRFITLLGGAAAWPLAARAQQLKPPTIGFMGESTPEGQRQWVAAFVQRLGERGWSEGRNVAIEYRWAGGHNERFADIVTDLVRLKVDVIVTPARLIGYIDRSAILFGHAARACTSASVTRCATPTIR
jgi:putative tryptophan/tyrosine transport system substrate-binding protein